MSLSAADCIAKAKELEEKAALFPTVSDSYRQMAAQWRHLAREAAFFQQPNFGFQASGMDIENNGPADQAAA